MSISITTTPVKWTLERIPGKYEVHTEYARLELTQKQAKVNITTEKPMVIINQYPCFAEEGLKNNFDLKKELSQLAYNNVMEYIAKTAQNGDAMKKIGHKANIMLDNIVRDSVTVHEFGYGTMPVSRPEFDVKGGTVNIEAEYRNNVGERNGVEGTYIPGDIKFDIVPSELKMKILSYGSIDISFNGNHVDSYI